MLSLILALILATSSGVPHKLKAENISCVNNDGVYSMLVVGKGTTDQEIEWSPNEYFTILGNEGYSGQLEGESGALRFDIDGGSSSGITSIAYPEGVWLRWRDYPNIVTHVRVPKECKGDTP